MATMVAGEGHFAKCVGSFSCCCGKPPDKRNFRTGRFVVAHGLKGYSPPLWEGHCKEREAAGHVASVVRKQRGKEREGDGCSGHSLLISIHPRNGATHSNLS